MPCQFWLLVLCVLSWLMSWLMSYFDARLCLSVEMLLKVFEYYVCEVAICNPFMLYYQNHSIIIYGVMLFFKTYDVDTLAMSFFFLLLISALELFLWLRAGAVYFRDNQSSVGSSTLNLIWSSSFEYYKMIFYTNRM